MSIHNLSRIVFIMVVLLCLVQTVYYYPLLPDRVASHFGVLGKPDAWSSKDSFVKVNFFVVGLIAILFSSIGYSLKRIPASLINLPNKDYWLSHERREETVDFLSRQFFWFGSATLLLLLDMFHQTFRVHLRKAQGLEHAFTSIAVYVAFSLIWGIGLILKFMRRP